MASYCEHCEGQRFDRARVLRVLRQMRNELRASRRRGGAADAIQQAIDTVRDLDIPHLEWEDEPGAVVH